MMGGAAAG
jgi:hypothetical protein